MDDKQQSSDSVAAGPAAVVVLLILLRATATLEGYYYPISAVIEMKTTRAVIPRLHQKAVSIILVFMQSWRYYPIIVGHISDAAIKVVVV